MPADFVDRISKVELHCHSDGTIDPEMIRALTTLEDRREFADALAATYPVASIDQWMNVYSPVAKKFLNPMAERLPLVVMAHADRWRRQNVRYAELFVSTILMGIADMGAMIECFRNLRFQLDSMENGPKVNLLVCVGRGNRQKLANQVPRMLALSKLGLITGVALAGDEAACSVRELQDCFSELHDHGLGVEIHAGEFCGPESVRDALDFGRPHRLGHGVRAFEDPSIVDRLAETGTHVEFCPTSNVRLGVIRSVEELPIRQALEAGIEFSINTDDPGVFQCSLTSEFRLVAETFGLIEDDLGRISRNSLRAAFTSP